MNNEAVCSPEIFHNVEFSFGVCVCVSTCFQQRLMFVGFIWDIIIRYQYTSKKRITIYIDWGILGFDLCYRISRFQQIRLVVSFFWFRMFVKKRWKATIHWRELWFEGMDTRGRKVLTIIIGSDCSMRAVIKVSYYHTDAQRKTQKLAGGLTPILISNIFGGWFPMVWIAEWAQIIHLDSIRTMTAFGRVVPRHTCGRIEQRPQGPEYGSWF